MKFVRSMVTFIDLGEEEILTTSLGVDEHCKNHGHYIHTICDNTGNQQAEENHDDIQP